MSEDLGPFDFVIVGSGFGGAVSAMRLSEKGYSVAVLESGLRYRPEDFPKTNWNLRKFLWLPWLKCFGIQRITLAKGLMLLHGAGVGGGSLVYAATLMRPEDRIFRSPDWPNDISWPEELDPHFREAHRMLGVATNPRLEQGEQILREISRDMKCPESFHATDVGIYFGPEGETTPDPYFGGKGPARMGCQFCGGCMVGCRYGSKNTLDLNYLYFAEKAGARIFPDTKVIKILPTNDGYQLETRRPSSLLGRGRGPTFRARKVILAAGVLGTNRLLLACKHKYKTLPHLSPRLGENVRTNGESLVGATGFKPDLDLSKGIAIGAAMHPDAQTKIESVRYPSGSSAMRLLAGPLTGPGPWWLRPFKLLFNCVIKAPQIIHLLLARDWAKQSLILLVMQSVDQSLRLTLGHGLRASLSDGLVSAPTDKPIPSFLPLAQEAATHLGRHIAGLPLNSLAEAALATPTTAHILGGCCLANSAENGVVNSAHETFGHSGLYVCDGSVIPANLAVNPSLTITALAERFASLFPHKKNGSR